MRSVVKKLIFISPYFFPAYLIRFSVWGIPFTLLEAFTYVLFGTWAVSRFREREAWNWNPRTRHYGVAIFLLIIGASIGAMVAPSFTQLPDGNVIDTQRIALGVWKGWIISPILYFTVLIQTIKNTHDVQRILKHFIHSAVALSGVSYLYALMGHGITYDHRLSGLFESANYLALYIGPALLLNIHELLNHPKQDREHHINVATLTVLAYTLIFTQSYAGLLAVLGAVFLYILHDMFRNHGSVKKPALALLGIVMATGLIMATQWNTPKFQNFLRFQERSSSSVRMEIYHTSLYMIQKKPWTGIGLGQFQSQYQINAPKVLGGAPLEWNMPHAHNLFLHHWLNTGIVGLVSLLFLIALAHQSFTYPLIALWGVLIHGLFDTPFWKNDLAMIFWLLIACIFILQQHANHPAQKRIHPKR